jgi:hypothetical protein
MIGTTSDFPGWGGGDLRAATATHIHGASGDRVVPVIVLECIAEGTNSPATPLRYPFLDALAARGWSTSSELFADDQLDIDAAVTVRAYGPGSLRIEDGQNLIYCGRMPSPPESWTNAVRKFGTVGVLAGAMVNLHEAGWESRLPRLAGRGLLASALGLATVPASWPRDSVGASRN